MKILNAGLETVQFGFNQNARDKRFGGFYSVKPGETIDVPEDARSQILNHDSGQKNYGVVILEFGTDLRSAQLEGLKNYVEYKALKVYREQQRLAEKEQNGVKVFGKPRALAEAEAAYERAVEAFSKLEASGETLPITKGQPLPVAGQAQRHTAPIDDDLNDYDTGEEDSDGDFAGDGEQGQAEPG